jgi:hypothetical protein
MIIPKTVETTADILGIDGRKKITGNMQEK